MRVVCTNCENELESIGSPFGPQAKISMIGTTSSLKSLEQWFGNVCTECKSVFCNSCIEVGGPTPCPKCGEPTKPAQRGFLEQIGAI